MTDIVEINNLAVSFSTDAGAVKAVDGVSLQVGPGRSARDRRGERERQDRHREDDPRPASRDGDGVGCGRPAQP